MEEIADLESLVSKCRLCGALGIHPMDILESGSAGPRNSNALSEKIFRCVGIRVEKNDMLTTKICGVCFAKINDFVLFRKICATIDVQLRIAMSNVSSHGSTAVSEVATEATNSSNEIYSTNGESESATATNRTIAGIHSAHTETNGHQSTKRTRRLADVRACFVSLVRVDITANADEVCANPSGVEAQPRLPLNSDCDANAHRRHQETPKAALTPTISLVDEESENESDASNSDEVESSYGGDIGAEIGQMTSNVETDNIRIFDVKCQYRGHGPRCMELFDSREAMIHHLETFHAKEIEKRFECHICTRVFTRKSAIQQHIDAVHYGMKPFQCPNQTCSKRFSQKSSLNTHVNSVHKNIKPFRCPNQTCSKRFSFRCNLDSHVNSVHKNLKSFQCQTCSKRFSQKSHLVRHVNSVHKNLKPFRCPKQTCSKRFSQKCNLKRHISSVHAERRKLCLNA